MNIEQYCKTDSKHWIFTEYDHANETVNLNSISFLITLVDISDKVEFDSIEISEE